MLRANKILTLFLMFLLSGMIFTSCTGREETPTETPTPTVAEPTATDGPTVTPEPTKEIYQEGWESSRPCIVHTRFETSDSVVADVIVTDDYGADNTGKADATAAIQTALNACAEAGGGTVFLPAGQYLVTDTLTVPSCVVLRGDWCDPEDAEDLGTVLVATPEKLSRDDENDAVSQPMIAVSSNAGLIGITVWYPEQSASNPIPYGYTVCIGTENSVRTATIRNVTLLNAYYGLYAGSSHEMLEVETLEICALKKGLVYGSSTEVGFSDNIRISPDIWCNTAEPYACDDEAALLALTRREATAFELGQTDDETLYGIRIFHYKTAISVNAPFWGMLYGVEIEDCGTGLLVSSLNPYAGMLVANGTIDCDTAVLSRTSSGAIKLCGMDLFGTVEGENIAIDEDSRLDDLSLRETAYEKPNERLYVADISAFSKKKKDISEILQATLDEAGKTGGVVRLPAGVYNLYKPVTVPAGVTLMGNMPIYVRDTTEDTPGTVIMSYVPDESAILLSENAGLSGLRLFCPMYDSITALELISKNDAKTQVALVKGCGYGVYITDCGITAAFIGVDFSDCDNHLMRNVFGCCYLSQAILGGKNGSVENCLQNMTFTQRHNLTRYFDSKYADRATDWMGLGCHVRDLVLRPYCTMFTLRDAENEQFRNVFMYAVNHLLESENSSATLCNFSVDFAYGYQLVLHNSNIQAVNSLRSCGGSVICDNSDVCLYNRIAISNQYEKPFLSDVSTVDAVEYTDVIALTACESLSGTKYVSLNTDTEYKTEGNASWINTHKPHTDSMILEATWNTTDISACVESGWLHISLYVSEYVNLVWGGSITLTSASGSADWSLPAHILKTGWNEVYLPFDSAICTSGFTGKGVNGISVRADFGADFTNVFCFDDIFACR